MSFEEAGVKWRGRHRLKRQVLNGGAGVGGMRRVLVDGAGVGGKRWVGGADVIGQRQGVNCRGRCHWTQAGC